MVAIAGSRFAERAIVTGAQSVRDRTGRRALIVGAGRTGRSLTRELRETAGERVVGFVDDNARLRRRRVHGVQVVGTLQELPRVLERTKPDVVLITIPNAPRERLDLVVDACAQAGFTPRIVFEASALPMVVQLATRGLGAAIIPASAAAAATAAIVVPITSPQVRSRLELAWNSTPPANPAARARILGGGIQPR